MLNTAVEDRFSHRTTHLIVDKLVRSEKLICAISRGRWVLHVDYVRNSLARKRWLDASCFYLCKKGDDNKRQFCRKKNTSLAIQNATVECRNPPMKLCGALRPRATDGEFARAAYAFCF